MCYLAHTIFFRFFRAWLLKVEVAKLVEITLLLLFHFQGKAVRLRRTGVGMVIGLAGSRGISILVCEMVDVIICFHLKKRLKKKGRSGVQRPSRRSRVKSMASLILSLSCWSSRSFSWISRAFSSFSFASSDLSGSICLRQFPSWLRAVESSAW